MDFGSNSLYQMMFKNLKVSFAQTC